MQPQAFPRNGRGRTLALGVVLGTVWLFWAATALTVFATFVVVTWNDRVEALADDGAGAGAQPTYVVTRLRPAGVPETAQQVEESLELGAPLSGEGAVRLLFHMSCERGLLTVVTTEEVLYSEVSCSQAPSRRQVDRMLGAPVHVQASPGTVMLESADAGRIELDAASSWVDRP